MVETWRWGPRCAMVDDWSYSWSKHGIGDRCGICPATQVPHLLSIVHLLAYYIGLYMILPPTRNCLDSWCTPVRLPRELSKLETYSVTLSLIQSQCSLMEVCVWIYDFFLIGNFRAEFNVCYSSYYTAHNVVTIPTSFRTQSKSKSTLLLKHFKRRFTNCMIFTW